MTRRIEIEINHHDLGWGVGRFKSFKVRIWYNFSVEVDQTSLLVALKKVSPPPKPPQKEEE